MPMHEQCLLWPIDVHSLILKSWSKMADLREITGFPILNIWRPFHSQISGVNDLSWTCLLMNNVCNGPLMYIASFWKLSPRWPTCGKLMAFPILNIWRPFHSHITGVNDSSWTCILMNNVCNGPLVYMASFWNLALRLPTCGKLHDFPYLTYGDLSTAISQLWMTWPR